VNASAMGDKRAEEAFLQRYDRRQFASPLTTVDVAIFSIVNAELCVLLIERSNFPAKGQFALPGGFIDEAGDATLLATAYRKLYEKTGVTAPHLEQVESIGGAVRDPRGWSVTVLYFALIDRSAVSEVSVSVSPTSTEPVLWAPVNEAVSMDLAFDHQDLFRRALERLRSKTRYTALPLGLMQNEFTLTELQHVFETILEVGLEKKSFRRRLIDSGAVVESGNVQHGVHRPAAMYRLGNVPLDFVFPRSLQAIA
jgi:8-oxo-dGTP diphosphatase